MFAHTGAAVSSERCGMTRVRRPQSRRQASYSHRRNTISRKNPNRSTSSRNPINPNPRNTASVCYPSFGPSPRVPPGVAESLGTTAGTASELPSASDACSIIWRALNCSSSNMSATL